MESRDRRMLIWILGPLVLCLSAYAAWTTYVWNYGAVIAKIQTERLRIVVLHMPYEFPLFNPVNTPWLTGDAVIRISDMRGREITSYTLRRDSWYPMKAEVFEVPDNSIGINVDGMRVACRINSGAENPDVTWYPLP